MDPTTQCIILYVLLNIYAYNLMAKKRNFLRVPGGNDRSKFKIDRTDLALNWQFDSTSEKVISSPANVCNHDYSLQYEITLRDVIL